jgi:hypothetical protein
LNVTNYLLGIFSNDIEVEVSPDYFYFRRKGRETRIKTIIYLSSDGKNRVLGVGDCYMPTGFHIKIELFEHEASNIGSYDKFDYLYLFFKYCIEKKLLIRKYELLRPLIIFRNQASLKGILSGDEKMILRNAAVNAGARECLFNE